MNTTLHVTIDKQTKAEASKLADEMGLDLSTIVKASLKNFVVTKTFHVERGYHMTPYLEQIIARAKEDFSAHRNVSGPFSTAGEVAGHLNKFIKK